MQVADVLVYQFTTRDRDGRKTEASRRWATLEAIKRMGEPILATQIVVNHTEIDEEGILFRFGDASHLIDDLWAQIRSLNLRAESRDIESQGLDEAIEADRKNILIGESRELRTRARQLTQQRTDLIVDRLGAVDKLGTFTGFGRLPSVE